MSVATSFRAFMDIQSVLISSWLTARQPDKRSFTRIFAFFLGFKGNGFGLRHAPEYYSLPERASLEGVASSIRKTAAQS